MTQTLYLDQNVLSDLRPRCLMESKSNEFPKLREAILSGQYIVVYSCTHLAEINKISDVRYQNEYVELLAELNACYLYPSGSHILERNPREVWAEYAQNKIENDKSGVTAALEAVDALNRKLCGLLQNEDISNIRQDVESSIVGMLNNGQETINSLLNETLSDDVHKALLQQLWKFDDLKAQMEALPEFPVANDEIRGPQAYRNQTLKGKDLSSVDESNVVTEINKLEGLKEREFIDHLEQSLAAPKHVLVAGLYNRLNWAGYFADDFLKVKPGRDRFNASSYDAQHAMWGSLCDVLVSNDKRFAKKAKACYSHLDIATIVMSVDDFVREMTKED